MIKTYHPDNQKALIANLNHAEATELGFMAGLKRQLKSMARKAVKKEIDRQMRYLPQYMPEKLGQPYDFSDKALPERMVYHEFFEHCLPALLRNFDRASMMNSVEIRMPFMDWRLVTYVFSLPTESKIGEGYTKLLLRKAMKGRIEESLRTRTFKVGIGSPIEFWLNGPIREWAIGVLKDHPLADVLKANKNLNLSEAERIWKEINLGLIIK